MRADFEAKLQSFYAGCQRIHADYYAKNGRPDLGLENPSLADTRWNMTRLKKWVRITKPRVFCFVDLETGDVLKASDWKRPALTKVKRGNIFDDYNGLKYIRPYGVAHADEVKGTRQQWTVK